MHPRRDRVGSAVTATTLAGLKQNTQIWYKIHVLLYDICNIATDRASEIRTLSTTDELYISAPYFTPSESAMIKAAIVEYNASAEDTLSSDGVGDPEDPTDIDATTKVGDTVSASNVKWTVEEAIKERLSGFFDKRRASGDSRPCGPHDMAAIYENVFGIQHSELQDERFLSRLRRSGLGESQEKKENEVPDGKKKVKKGRN
ncbi:MAG: hypothetical protein MMC33_005143 [Icmadophila ericetorum]|nr:hypothetical protein [Icmadophila ericetorum]